VQVAQPEGHPLLVSVGEKYEMPPWYMLPLLVARLSAITMSLLVLAQARGLRPQRRESATRECFPGVLFFTCTQPPWLVICFLGPLPGLRLGESTVIPSWQVAPRHRVVQLQELNTVLGGKAVGVVRQSTSALADFKRTESVGV